MKPAFWRRALSSLLLLSLVLTSAWPSGAQAPQSGDAPKTDVEIWLDETLAGMTTADKIGQLFLVTFPGQVALRQPAAPRPTSPACPGLPHRRRDHIPGKREFRQRPGHFGRKRSGTPQQVPVADHRPADACLYRLAAD